MGSNEPQNQSRASQLEESMTKRLRQQRNPFLKPVFAVAATGALLMIFGLVLQMVADSKKEIPAPQPQAIEVPEKTHLTIHGECVCICCTLQISEQHHRAVRYRGGENQERLILLQHHTNMNMNLAFFCEGPTPALVEGDMVDSAGLRILHATAFKAFPEARP